MAQQAVVTLKEQFCPDHEKVKISMVCKDCDLKKVCVTCIATTHQGHRLIEIENYVRIEKDLLKGLLTDAEKTKDIVKTRLQKTWTVGERNSSNTNMLKRQLTTKAETMKHCIDEWLTESCQECDELFTENRKVIDDKEKKISDKLNDLESVIKRTEVALDSTSYENVSPLKEALSTHTTDAMILTVPIVQKLELRTAKSADITTLLGSLKTIKFDLDLQGCEINSKNLRRKEYMDFNTDCHFRKGDFDNTPVTIKEYKPDQNLSQEEFLIEAQILRHLHHPNVIHMHGVIKDVDQPAIIFEDMSHGNLLDFVTAEAEWMSLSLLLDFSLQIASGMEYVSSSRVVHRDLIAGNIMMVNKKTVKIANFSRCVEIAENSEQWTLDEGCRKKQMFAIKWAAIEALETNRFSVASDVWAFGVLVWELMSLGSRPYSGMTTKETAYHVIDGNILPKPQLCTENVYEVLKMCWDKDPKQRPKFEELVEVLNVIKQSVKPLTTAIKPTLKAITANLNVAKPAADETERNETKKEAATKKKSLFQKLLK